MTITVLPIFDTDFRPEAGLAKIMNDRLSRAAAELRDRHLKDLEQVGRRDDDLVVYLSYNSKFTVRWRVVNDVPPEVEAHVAEVCGALGYIAWKIAGLNVFKGNGM
ncbi:hypothetical protein C7T94_13465 [Pedobacter yulinensis]|uniref:Uncharacterized protein n=1 Tax=Pedobacter yulinensis TaxID=2126353 RepID=A0A2T3HN54_9SPHI|nr:hypothetical protein [Pedobacter yulinensis]PST83859.1 hypothetical protein C7T94_13465 [Pedobacter yulinensis]